MTAPTPPDDARLAEIEAALADWQEDSANLIFPEIQLTNHVTSDDVRWLIAALRAVNERAAALEAENAELRHLTDHLLNEGTEDVSDSSHDLSKAIEAAKQAGFQIESIELIPGTTGYQLKAPDGRYVQFGGTEASVWKHAYEAGLLPHSSRED